MMARKSGVRRASVFNRREAEHDEMLYEYYSSKEYAYHMQVWILTS